MPKLRDGVIERGGSWSYVIRVPDPATGVSKPRWVGGFDTEEIAKAARDEARVRARNGHRISRMRLQALRPAVISRLYRDLADRGGRGGRDSRALSASTVSHIHHTLRKALADAVDIEQLLAANPAARSKRPRSTTSEHVQVWTADQLGTFLAAARSHRLFALLPPGRLHRSTTW
jgi:integrase